MALIDFGLRLLIAFIFFVLTTLILQEAAKILKLDDSVHKSSQVSFFISLVLLIFSYIPFFYWFMVFIVISFFFLIQYYYNISFKKALLLWLSWLISYLALGLLLGLFLAFV